MADGDRQLVNSAIYEGYVRHRRYRPVAHAFSYRLFMMYLDLAELPSLFERRLLWSVRRPALARFKREDHLGPADVPLDVAVRDLVERSTGRRPSGSIHLMTHLRYFGYCFNPVSFYFVHDQDDAKVSTIVAEVNNTPWNEQHTYVLDSRESVAHGEKKHFRFAKEFHVSPFHGMNQTYDWRFTDPAATFAIHMENHEGSDTVFDATMLLRRREITSLNLARVLARYPLMTAKVISAIHWQALKLWLKNNPVHPHPAEVSASSYLKGKI
jgi:DUF1365 family protein